MEAREGCAVNCPKPGCGLPTRVVVSNVRLKEEGGWDSLRKRECAQGHRFYTAETFYRFVTKQGGNRRRGSSN